MRFNLKVGKVFLNFLVTHSYLISQLIFNQLKIKGHVFRLVGRKMKKLLNIQITGYYY